MDNFPLIALVGRTVKIHVNDECPQVLRFHGDSKRLDGKLGIVRWIWHDNEASTHVIAVQLTGGLHAYFAAYELEAFDPYSQEILAYHRQALQDDDSRLVRIERRTL